MPNITPEDGIGRRRAGDPTYYLKTGFRPDGDVAGGAMSGVIEDVTAHLGDADRAAIAAYLSSLRPIPRQRPGAIPIRHELAVRDRSVRH
ncbi:MAG: hypothetical protein IH900_08065 [Proteobacteria bacterium]|nr:hypothetical protein [Pseudomonadota bacterium]